MKKTLTVLLLSVGLFSACSSDETAVEPTTLVQEEMPSPANPLVPNSNPANNMFEKICENGEEQEGPWNNDLVLSWFDEQSRTSGESQTVVEAGGVPTVIQDENGRLVAAFQWFSCEADKEAFDKVAVAFSDDDGETWSEPEPIVIEDFPEEYQRPFDPTLALLEDGRIRMYYTSNSQGISTFGDDTNIYSAISEDGINYTFEEGARLDLDGLPAYDCAVGYWDELWHIITPNNTPINLAGAHHATSTDGLNFTQTDDLATDDVNWTGNFLAKEDGLYFYGTSGGKDGNWFVKTDGVTWEEPEFLQIHGGDPAVACNQDACFAITVQMPTMPLK